MDPAKNGLGSHLVVIVEAGDEVRMGGTPCGRLSASSFVSYLFSSRKNPRALERLVQ